MAGLGANGLLASLILKGGMKLLHLAVDSTLLKPPAKADAPKAKASKAEPKPKHSVTGMLAGATAARIATTSVPGAIIVAGGLLAKTLYDRKKARRSKRA